MGVSSYTLGLCGTEGVVDGFAKVTHQINWIVENSDDYVKSCSGWPTDFLITARNETVDKNDNLTR